MASYRVILKDAEDYEINTHLTDGLKAAKEQAKYLLTDTYARRLGTSHDSLNTHKVEVREEDTLDCVWDAFRKEG
jgi:hypothetical protein